MNKKLRRALYSWMTFSILAANVFVPTSRVWAEVSGEMANIVQPAASSVVSNDGTPSDGQPTVYQKALMITTQDQQADWPETKRLATIEIDGKSLPQAEEGTYVEIRHEADFLDEFAVDTANFIQKTEFVEEGNQKIARVYLGKVDTTKTLKFNYSLTFKEGLTPNGYRTAAKITWHRSDGSLLANPEGEVNFQVKTEELELLKLPGMEHHQNDVELYAGEADSEGVVQQPADVLFRFRAKWNGSDSTTSAPDYRHIRRMKSIVIRDTLPTYINEQNEVKRAQLSPVSKENGWVDQGDGTVSYTLELANQRVDSIRELEKVHLYLRFPGFKKGTYQNQATVMWHPYNETDQDQKISSSTLNFHLRTELLQDGIVLKRHEHTLKVREGSNHNISSTNQGTYLLEVDNKTPYALTELTITDFNLDKHLLYHHFEVFDSRFELIGVDKNGQEYPLNPNAPILDEVAINNITELAAKVEKNELEKSSVPMAEQMLTKLIIRLKPGQEIKANEGIWFRLNVVPSVLYKNQELLDLANHYQLTNSATFIGKLKGTNQEISFEKTLTDSLRVEEATYQVGLKKSTKQEDTGSIGSSVTYQIDADLSKAFFTKAGDANLPKIIDILPSGITAESVVIDNPRFFTYEIIKNYHDTKQEAIVFTPQGDFDPAKASRPTFIIKAKITANALPTISDETGHRNDNIVYFTAGNTVAKPLYDNGTEVDRFDVNENGNTEELLVAARSKTTVSTPAEVYSRTLIKKADETEWSDQLKLLNFAEKFAYRLQTINNSKDAVSYFVLYSKLPSEKGDVGFTSKVNGPVTAPQGFHVYYSVATDMPDDPVAGVARNDWQDSVDDYSKVTAIKVVLEDMTQAVKPGEDINVDIPLDAPIYPDTDKLNERKNAHSFWVSRDANEPSKFRQANVVNNQLPKYITVTKQWQEVPGEKSPDEVEIEVFAKNKPNEVLATVVLNASNHWTMLVKETKDKKLFQPGIELSVREKETEDKADYDSSVEELDNSKQLILTNKRKVIEHTVTKEWNDEENIHQTRPQSIKVQLYRSLDNEDPEPYGAVVELSNDNEWSYTYQNLPKSVKGIDYNYYVQEVEVPNGYTPFEQTFEDTTTLTNTFNPVLADLEWMKELRWNSLTGRLQPLQGGEFEFVLLDENAKIVATTTNTYGDATTPAKVNFAGIRFYRAGEYHYSVQEVVPHLEGNKLLEAIQPPVIDYDSQAKHVKIIVEMVDGQLQVTSVTYEEDNRTFINVVKLDAAKEYQTLPEWHGKPIAVLLDFEKELRSFHTKSPLPLHKDDFSFQLRNEQREVIDIVGNEDSLIQTAGGTSSVEPAKINFKPLVFTQPGTYHYYVSEVIPSQDATSALQMKYDNLEREVIVTVTATSEGELQANVEYTLTDAESTAENEAFLPNVQSGLRRIQQRFTNIIKIQAAQEPALPEVPMQQTPLSPTTQETPMSSEIPSTSTTQEQPGDEATTTTEAVPTTQEEQLTDRMIRTETTTSSNSSRIENVSKQELPKTSSVSFFLSDIVGIGLLVIAGRFIKRKP